MVLTISQETFNEAVLENLNDLGLSAEEAVEEAVIQFESQGVDLSNIIKTIMENPTSNVAEIMAENIKKLADLTVTKSSSDLISTQLQVIKEECNKGLEYKLAAGKASAYEGILDTMDKYNEDPELVAACLKTMLALMNKQPDLLTSRGIEVILKYLNKNSDLECKKLALKWAKTCCVMHEMNRQNLFNAHIVDKLKELLGHDNADVIKEALGVCRALVLDDDVRVEFGKAHEHARVIAGETLHLLTGLLNSFQSDENMVHDLVLTLSALLVRTEFCKNVDEAGGLKFIYDSMRLFTTNEKINRQCFKLIKVLAGNDECKMNIIKNNLSPLIVENLNNHKINPATATAGLSCVAALTLRCPDNSKVLFDDGVSEVIVSTMRVHPHQKDVQKNASWAIRNMVSRSRYQCPKFLELGVEELLQANLNKYKEIEYDMKAALRDLGCEVQLKEEWTGKGGMLTSGGGAFGHKNHLEDD